MSEPSKEAFAAIQACHAAHFYEDGLCAECLDAHTADLTARLAAVQGKDDVNRSLRFLLAQKDAVIADLRDALTAAVAQANQERDDLQAWIDRAERKGAIDANMLSAPDALTPPPGGAG